MSVEQRYRHFQIDVNFVLYNFESCLMSRFLSWFVVQDFVDSFVSLVLLLTASVFLPAAASSAGQSLFSHVHPMAYVSLLVLQLLTLLMLLTAWAFASLAPQRQHRIVDAVLTIFKSCAC